MQKFFSIFLIIVGLATLGLAVCQSWVTNIGLQENAVILGPMGMIMTSISPFLGGALMVLGYQGLTEKD